ncbi:MAG: peptide-methionine (S)-S-oxide reductase [Patescibacteria group bacterium]|nr:peptide-methionine (S)-S-oxide reductase [Patescibacteria group bacterium]
MFGSMETIHQNSKKSLGTKETAYLGGGCFWCTEAVFARIKGIVSVTPGYAGGVRENPTYEEVSGGATGHAEVVKVEYDPALISYETILNIFFATHNPTTPNRQGMDVGTQYRSVIFFEDDWQKEAAEKFVRNLEAERIFENTIVTEIKLLEKFYEAESYHKKYFEKNSQAAYCQTVISPKIAKLRRRFKDWMK